MGKRHRHSSSEVESSDSSIDDKRYRKHKRSSEKKSKRKKEKREQQGKDKSGRKEKHKKHRRGKVCTAEGWRRIYCYSDFSLGQGSLLVDANSCRRS